MPSEWKQQKQIELLVEWEIDKMEECEQETFKVKCVNNTIAECENMMK